MDNNLLRNLPKVDEILKEEEIIKYLEIMPHEKVVENIREVIDDVRKKIVSGDTTTISYIEILSLIKERLNIKRRKSLRPVINGTGVILHTNLGRANLSDSAREEMIKVSSSYSTLEYDPVKGERGSRHDHIEEVIKKITGAEAAMVVNNNASATMLSIAALARGKEVIVSRGELVEIGGSFRVPDIMAESGAKLVEVGTTNKTKFRDYKRHINSNTGLLMKVHTSNYRIVGFTDEVSLKELRTLADSTNLPLIYDMGSGLMVDLKEYGIDEPNVKDAIKDGADIVLFSGDKLLGGPQAGIIIGKKEYIDLMKTHPLARVLRVDKLTLSALSATFDEYYDKDKAINNIPVLKMITRKEDYLLDLANSLKEKIDNLNLGYITSVIETEGLIGGGSCPLVRLKDYALAIRHDKYSVDNIEKKLRNTDLPIVGRIVEDKLLIDTRTLFEEDILSIVSRLEEIGK